MKILSGRADPVAIAHSVRKAERTLERERTIMKLRISVTLKVAFFIKLRFLIAERHFPGVIFKPRFPLGLARKISGNVKIYFHVFIEFNNAGIWLIKHENLGYKSITAYILTIASSMSSA